MAIRLGFLFGGERTYLIDEGAAVQSGYLTATHVGNFEIRVQQEVERKGDVLAGIVHADVEVQLLFAQDQAIG